MTGLGYNDMLGYDSVIHVAFTGDKWVSLKWDGVAAPEEEAFYGTVTNHGWLNLTSAVPCFAIMTNSTETQTFDWEFYAHFEVVGHLARGKTPTWADPQAVGVVNTAIRIANQTSDAQSHSSPLWRSKLLHYIKEGARMAMPYAVPAAKVAIAGYFGGPAAAGAAVMSQIGGPKKKAKKQPKKAVVARPRLAIRGK
jgi:hypothetical protein